MAIANEYIDLHGVVFLRREAMAEGYSDRAIAAQVKSGEWHRVRRGAYCSGALWGSLSRADQHRVLARAVLRTAHPTSVLSHQSAAIEHGAPVWGVPLNQVHLTRTDGKAGRREAGLVHHRGALPQEHVVTLNGVPVTSATRVAVEVTTVASVESALVTVNGLLHAKATTQQAISALVNDFRFWPHSLAADLVMRLADHRIESPGESRFLYLCWNQHLPRPKPQVWVYEAGRRVARLDFAWPEYGVFVEFDGREKYVRFRREGETLDQFLMREKKREERVCLLTGWVCIRISWADLSQPEVTARRIRRLLARRKPKEA
ncbi:MAG: type IV toxin-antitoxin system AbiEi family antitoxin domain-containing protein [Nocardioides sp.]|nr:type IV toxin-antitoxin system AbiEi family antitoxin domain-containing protein [Nocardioides sp.]